MFSLTPSLFVTQQTSDPSKTKVRTGAFSSQNSLKGQYLSPYSGLKEPRWALPHPFSPTPPPSPNSGWVGLPALLKKKGLIAYSPLRASHLLLSLPGIFLPQIPASLLPFLRSLLKKGSPLTRDGYTDHPMEEPTSPLSHSAPFTLHILTTQAL